MQVLLCHFFPTLVITEQGWPPKQVSSLRSACVCTPIKKQSPSCG